MYNFFKKEGTYEKNTDISDGAESDNKMEVISRLFWLLNVIYFVGETFLRFFIRFSIETRSIEGADGSVPKIYYLLLVLLVIFILAVDIRKTYINYTEKKRIAGLIVLEVLILILPFVLIR